MIVVDTNVISYFLFPTVHTESTDALYQLDCNWVAPILWKSEFRNVLALYLRKKIITLEKAMQLQEYAESVMTHNEFEVASPQVLALINESRCSSYDCEFVALAHYLNIKLITQDKKILTEFPATAMAITDYLNTNGVPL